MKVSMVIFLTTNNKHTYLFYGHNCLFFIIKSLNAKREREGLEYQSKKYFFRDFSNLKNSFSAS